MVYDIAANLVAARSQMAFTLGFHIILACLGVGLPTLVLIANWIGLRRADSAALLLARRWSLVMAVTFAVGAVTGTVLSCPMIGATIAQRARGGYEGKFTGSKRARTLSGDIGLATARGLARGDSCPCRTGNCGQRSNRDTPSPLSRSKRVDAEDE